VVTVQLPVTPVLVVAAGELEGTAPDTDGLGDADRPSALGDERSPEKK
jgi:hypothetical protein